MKRLYLAFLLLLLASPAFAGFGMQIVDGPVAESAPAGNTFSDVVQAAGTLANSSSGTAQLTSVSSGQPVVVLVCYSGGSGNVSLSDGSSTFTAGTVADGTYKSQFFYTLSSSASGTVTYTASRTGANWVQVIATKFTSSGTPELDQQNVGYGNTATAVSGAITTTNATATASGISFGGWWSLDGANSASGDHLIAGVAADGYQMGGSQISGVSYKIENAAYSSGTASFGLSASVNWSANIISFK